MAILIYPGGATVVREPSNGCYFTRAEKEQMVPGGDMVTFLTDEAAMLSCSEGSERLLPVNFPATERMREMTGRKDGIYLYGRVLLFNPSEYSCETKKKRQMKHIDIYTDGSCAHNPGGAGGTGWVILIEGEVLKYGGTGYESTTNNRMEMRAVIEAFSALQDAGVEIGEDDAVTVYSDSQNVILPLTGRWKAHKNLDLWKPLFDVRSRYRVRWQWVKGHAGNKYNEMCDQLAVEASCAGPLLKDVGYK